MIAPNTLPEIENLTVLALYRPITVVTGGYFHETPVYYEAGRFSHKIRPSTPIPRRCEKSLMNTFRRSIIKLLLASSAVTTASLFGVRTAFAAVWNKTGFESKSSSDALKTLGVSAPTASRDIQITAPEIAENGAQVPVTVTSKIPNTHSISIVVDKNPFPLSSTFEFSSGAESYVSTRLKMGQTSNVIAVIKADGKFYTATKEVKVTIGGCGG
jgi:sulfur-oxidizing protein SoxY